MHLIYVRLLVIGEWETMIFSIQIWLNQFILSFSHHKILHGSLHNIENLSVYQIYLLLYILNEFCGTTNLNKTN